MVGGVWKKAGLDGLGDLFQANDSMILYMNMSVRPAPGLQILHVAEGRSMALWVSAGKGFRGGIQDLRSTHKSGGSVSCRIKILQQFSTAVLILDFRAWVLCLLNLRPFFFTADITADSY